jgi:hypothetical protein
MKTPGWIIIVYLFALTWASCLDFTSPGTFSETGRIYSPDSTKFLLKYQYIQGAWDGGRTWSTTILNRGDSVRPENIKFSYTNYDFDQIYWKTKDTVILEEKFTEFVANGRSNLKDTTLNGVTIHVIQRDPIDSSYTRKIFYQQVSPNGKYDLYVYKYVKPENGNYFLNISIVKAGDSLPKFGNFYVSRYDFDCFTDIRWDSVGMLDIKVSESCYYSFVDYLVKSRPDIKYKVAINDTIQGNIRSYMQ